MALGYLAQVVFSRIAPQTRSVCLRFEWPRQKGFAVSLLVLEVDPGPGFVEVEAHGALFSSAAVSAAIARAGGTPARQPAGCRRYNRLDG
jgi:hypothetical protein